MAIKWRARDEGVKVLLTLSWTDQLESRANLRCWALPTTSRRSWAQRGSRQWGLSQAKQLRESEGLPLRRDTSLSSDFQETILWEGGLRAPSSPGRMTETRWTFSEEIQVEGWREVLASALAWGALLLRSCCSQHPGDAFSANSQAGLEGIR